MSRTYPNITLTAFGGDLSVVVYLPIGVERRSDGEPFYYSSRFDHGSMIGSITRRRKARNTNTNSNHNNNDSNNNDRDEREPPLQQDEHVLYGTDAWRLPHNTRWPESGVGLAAEFGAGDDGALCDFRCGWPEAAAVTNGVLGYQEAANGDSFLKIGVGELVKGTCPACDSTDDYRFNSPYMFANQPVWTMTRASRHNNAAVQLEHQALLRNYGYNLKKEITLTNNVLSVTTTLQNLGDAPFSTVWYSHNFFTCDRTAVGPGYSLDLDIKGASLDPVYEEPATWSWSTPLQDYGRVKSYPNSVHLDLTRVLDAGTRIKAEFADDHVTTGGFTVTACETAVESRIVSADFSRDNANSPISMYAYNLYIERGTLSPEPQLLINNLQSGASVSWTQLLVIHDDGFEADGPQLQQQQAAAVPVDVAHPWWDLRGMTAGGALQSSSLTSSSPSYGFDTLVAYAGVLAACCCLAAMLLLLLQQTTRCRRRRNYDDLS